ncbi:hypothetical protein OV203_17185 [Nannocystis sp. ILAH1]|uniref:hypothetical protein n=1 Tax=unclassified Nannocystis TaxID=2627009 RepID=UPI00226FBE68|nr:MULTISPECIES: hypothetical protein [unclassified Nannocystis]MCY0988874.1 hypothetical protein [Nannocystis sp. ILAH1]MCY1072700.1 hypothetical protein [Nannocystis sp. RBIL2]
MSCATGTEKMVRRAVPAGIDETLNTLEDPRTQKRIEGLLDLPEVQKAARDLAGQVAAGAFDGLTDDQRLAKVRQVSEDYVGALSKAVGQGLREDVSPALVDTTRQAVEQAIHAALSPATRQGAANMAEALTRRTLTTLSEGLRDELGPATQTVLERNVGPALQRVVEDNVGPALRHTIEKDLAPALREALTRELAPAAGKVSREVSREALLGAVDALEVVETDPQYQGFRERFWGRIDDTLNKGAQVGERIAWILALIVIILGLLLARAIVVRRREQTERERSERMLLAILQELQQGGAVKVEQVVDHVRARDPDLARSSSLNAMIQRAVAISRDLFDGRPDLDGKPDAPRKR